MGLGNMYNLGVRSLNDVNRHCFSWAIHYYIDHSTLIYSSQGITF